MQQIGSRVRYDLAENVYSEIHVKKGQDVTLEISTTDVQHGFSVKDLGPISFFASHDAAPGHSGMAEALLGDPRFRRRRERRPCPRTQRARCHRGKQTVWGGKFSLPLSVIPE